VVGQDGQLPLPWLAPALQRVVTEVRAHALLLHGPAGVGQFELATTVAQAWLCEAPSSSVGVTQPCGQCASCRLIQAGSHPDLMVQLPEELRESLGWQADTRGDDTADKASKAKPSKDIKVEAIRAVVAFSQATSSRGRGKVVVLHPAERMNVVAANTLLKTLEEPPGQTRFVLSTGEPDALLPTVRSRCQALSMHLPDRAQSLAWLEAGGIKQASALLDAAGGQPQLARDWAEQGLDASLWLRLPELARRGEADEVSTWPLPRLVDALHKLCHDHMCRAVSAPPRFFPQSAFGQASRRVELAKLQRWSQSLSQAARHAEHPWNAALMAESLMLQACQALEAP
jgi:DNA polymerase III subunit delta'